MCCIFQNSALQFMHPTSKIALYPHATLFHIIFGGSLSLSISNGIFYYKTLCGAMCSLQALLINVTLCLFLKHWMAETTNLSKGW